MQKALIIIFLLLSSLYSQEHKILLLHSYHQDYPWTKSQNDSFTKSLKGSIKGSYELSTEYLDTKHIEFDDDYQQHLFEYLEHKYHNNIPDLIYVTDDHALRFMLRFKKQLFPSSHIVFSGVNDLALGETLDAREYTGVFEHKEALANLRLIRQLFPDEKSVLFIGDESDTFGVIQAEIEKQQRAYGKISVDYASSKQLDTLIKKIKEHPARVIILTTIGALANDSGSSLPLEKILHAIVSAKRSIIFSMEDVYIQQGVLGGYVTDGNAQGKIAAGFAVAYLHQKETLPADPFATSPNDWVFDFQALQDRGLKLPEEIKRLTTFINEPAGLYESHKKLIINTLFSMILLGFIGIIIFVIYIYRSRQIILRQTHEIQNAKESIIASEEKYRNLVENSLVGIYRTDIDGNIHYVNNALSQLMEFESQDKVLQGRSIDWYKNPRDRYLLMHELQENGLVHDFEFDMVTKKGHIKTVMAAARLDGKSVLGMIMDITETKKGKAEITKLSQTLEQIDDAVVITDTEGIITHANKAFLKESGYTLDELIDRHTRMLRSGKQSKAFYKKMWETILDGRTFRGQFINRRKNGEIYHEEKTITPIYDEKGEITAFASTGRDITERIRAQKEMEALASTDKLTGIFNRHKFEELFSKELERAQRYHHPLSLLLFDIDYFKTVNDTYGHDVGDSVLCGVADIISQHVRQNDIFARWGGEEFTVLVTDTDLQGALNVAQKLRGEIEKHLFEEAGKITASFGVSCFIPDDTLDTLLKRADQALYRAKKNGRNRVEADEQDV